MPIRKRVLPVPAVSPAPIAPRRTYPLPLEVTHPLPVLVESLAKRNGKRTTVKCPFAIRIDTKEQLPYTFLDIKSNADTDRLPFEVEIIRTHLDYLGDYSIYAADATDPESGTTPTIMIERKSAADLFGSVGNRENFEWRLNRLCEESDVAYVVVESEISSMERYPPSHTEMSFLVVHRTIHSWTQRFPKVHWFFYTDRRTAEINTFWLMYRFYENIVKQKSDHSRQIANFSAYWSGQRACFKRARITDCPYKKVHPFGDEHDYWISGYIAQERIINGVELKSLIAENPMVPASLLANISLKHNPNV
jgi:hypothetical protein